MKQITKPKNIHKILIITFEANRMSFDNKLCYKSRDLKEQLMKLCVKAGVKLQQNLQENKRTKIKIAEQSKNVERLKEQNAQMDILIDKLSDLCKKCKKQLQKSEFYSNLYTKQDAYSEETQTQNQKVEKEQSPLIQVVVPDLSNLQKFFLGCRDPILQKNYQQLKKRSKEDEQKHRVQMEKLSYKLQITQQKGREVIAKIKNSRKF